MISESSSLGIIFGCCALGILWGIFNTVSVLCVRVDSQKKPLPQLRSREIGEGDTEEGGSLVKEEEPHKHIDSVEQDRKIIEIGAIIAKGADSFLFAEYLVQMIFVVILAILIYCLIDEFTQCYTTVAYVIGSLISMLCGFIGMRIGVRANYRTTSCARYSLEDAFQVAYKAGNVMGFMLVSISLLVMTVMFIVYIKLYQPVYAEDGNTYAELFDYIAGYGLGGSTMALFGRVGGGIYTKAADVGADIVGKVEQGWDEDHPKNPATIADNVGDNVGDIAGMGSDLFGSFAESTCAALVVSAAYGGEDSYEFLFSDSGNLTGVMFPFLISAVGIVVCFLTAIFGIWIYKVNSEHRIQKALILQLAISTVLMLFALFGITALALPNYLDSDQELSRWYVPICAGAGLIAGFLIGLSTDYYTSNAHRPVQELATACETGAATNIIYGLALGYNSTIPAIILLALVAYLSNRLLGMYGVALSALGMLSTLAVGLAIDAYGPISDNAGGIAEMAELEEEVRKKTDALDAAGNTTAAIGKGFAIGSAALVCLSLYGAFLTRATECPNDDETSCNLLDTDDMDLNNPLIFAFLLIGAMLPYAFSALTMKSVGEAAALMVEEVRRQIHGKDVNSPDFVPDYNKCIAVSTNASLREMIAPGCIVIFVPMICGFVVGVYSIAGLIPGALVSGVQLAVSMANTGGAWDNAKKFIESGRFKNKAGEIRKKRSDEHKAAVVGDTVGDPLKDTSGPSLNILIKLMAIFSLVFCSFYVQTGYLQTLLLESD